MKRIANAFWSEDEGNVTIDWVVLMAGIVSLGFAVAATVATGAKDVTADMVEQIDDIEVASGA
ncbi:hypothetical protein KUV47_00575 [Vannielia litorea]|uniref:hypothetical protein n=1 Tax=Vannielia TaxID=2813041 RepID=UPI001C972CAA|nr:hypothetical protein [Vannielia litorea]MBY6048409.1 hypothetical protein [Vannielia litorea]MBY6075823.1 hypothetical protein [Vannielia litorea]MBY6151690.1 hypothetical protein [Vannielia litorea]